MAIATPTLINGGQDLGNNSRITIPTSGTISLTSGRLYILGVQSDMGTGDVMSGFTAGVIGAAVNFSFGSYGNFSDDDDLAYWTYVPTTDHSNVSVAVHSNQGAQSCFRWGLIEIAYGFNRSAITKQAVFAVSSASSYVNHVLTSPDADSVGIIFAGNSTDNVTHTPRNYTELGESGTGGSSSDAGTLSFGYASPAVSTASTALNAGTGDFGGWVLEIDANAGAATDDAMVRFGSMSLVDGSGLVTADFTASAGGGGVFGSGYWLRRTYLDAMTSMDDV